MKLGRSAAEHVGLAFQHKWVRQAAAVNRQATCE